MLELVKIDAAGNASVEGVFADRPTFGQLFAVLRQHHADELADLLATELQHNDQAAVDDNTQYELTSDS